MLASSQPNNHSHPPSPPSPPSHLPTNAYTTGLPTPPRILVPPPSLNASGSDDLSEWEQPSLQSFVLPSDPPAMRGSQDWRYEFRREAQQLLPHLFLGPLSAAKNHDFLRCCNISLLLAVRSSMTARAHLLSPTMLLPGVRYESIDVGSHHELISQFQRANQIIDEHYVSAIPKAEVAASGLTVPLDGRQLRSFQERYMTAKGTTQPPGGRTLIFCESGNERSAVVAAAYIMQHLRGSTIQAVQLVQARRFCVCFDDNMKWMLSNYEPIYIARRMQQGHLQQQQQQQQTGFDGGAVGGGGGGGSGMAAVGGSGKGKRRLDDDDGDDEDWNSGGRAPFWDQNDQEDQDMS